MSDDLVTIKVNGKELKARRGAMLIEVTDEAGIDIPRFCYHKKLSVAANCRMCLVEIEKARKPMPACATPVAEDMVVWTNSPGAIAAQKSTMEFLLINHPLDCPICDQGGECELQDVAMGYGDGVGKYTEAKRVVKDKDIGPLIATDMTRCIHCTRCVRFGEEIAGLRELGAVGRSEHMEIGTYIEKSLVSELSGNVIDLCPVGALTAKPSRYTHRPWELMQHRAVAPHDAVGSNLFLHSREGRIMRVVPRENEEINETWIADRDRFSYTAIYHEDRVERPMIRRDGEWREVEWQEALEFVAQGLRDTVTARGADAVGALAAPHSTLEELYLLQKLMRGLGSGNVDHRLMETDFADQEQAPVMPWLGHGIQDFDGLDAALLVGSRIRTEQPIMANRLRKAVVDNGARVAQVNPRACPLTFDVEQEMVVAPEAMLDALAAIAAALGGEATGNEALDRLLAKAEPGEAEQAIAAMLRDADKGMIYLGAIAAGHPRAATLRSLAALVAERAGVGVGHLPRAGNSAGAWLAGMLPHRGAGGASARHGRDWREQLRQGMAGLWLHNLEPEFDTADPALAMRALDDAEFVVCSTPFASERMREYADAILPVGTFAETSGTYVNAEGYWQSHAGAARPVGEARPGWKLLRVMGNLLELEGFEYVSSEDVRTEVQKACMDVELDNRLDLARAVVADYRDVDDVRIAEVPIYAGDHLVRRSADLQASATVEPLAATVSPAMAEARGLEEGDEVRLRQGAAEARLPVRIDAGVAPGCVHVPVGMPGSETLGGGFAAIEIVKG